MDYSVLEEAGLTDGEIKTYMALLELGPSTTGPIIDHCGISRSIIYQILEKLMKKGLVSYITRGQTKHYQAAEPRKLLEYVDGREDALLKNKEALVKILPELAMKQAIAVKSEAAVYLGKQGIQTVNEHTYDKLKKGEKYVFLGIPAYQPDEMHMYWKRDHVRRTKAGIQAQLLFNSDTPKEILKDRASYKGCEVRSMTSEMVTPAGILIYKDTVAIILQNPEKIAVEIVNQSIADSFMAFYKEFWKRSKPFTG